MDIMKLISPRSKPATVEEEDGDEGDSPDGISWRNLPPNIKKKCLKLKIPIPELKENITYVWNICDFLYPESFVVKVDAGPPKPRIPYASAEMMGEVEKEMVVQKSSNLKKQYGKVNFTGRGGFASVFSAKDLTSKKNESVAIKKLPHNTEKEKLNNLCEIAFLKICVSHPNAVQYIKSFLVQPENEIWLVTEFLHGGTLSEAARVHTFIERHIAYVAREVLRALKFLHDNKFAHRDLKSTNVMMSINGSIKIIDFGLCADFTNGPRTNMVGSPFWIPPEMIKKEPHSLKVDCYSLAVCLLELFLMAPPHSTSGIKCMYMAVTKGLHDQIPKTASPEASSFLRKALEVDPEKRATANQLLEEPWIAEPGLSKGISEVLRDIFLTNTINDMGLY